MNQVFLQDCMQLNPNLHYDYIITSPPDFDELGMDPTPAGQMKYFGFLLDRLGARPCPYITIIIRDRKFNGTVVDKQAIIQKIFNFGMSHKLLTHKIWVRSYKTNLYKFNYSHILTFGYKGNNKHLPDVFFHEHKAFNGYKENFVVDLIKPFIECYTKPGDVVYDPFMGSGTTAIAAIQTVRNYLGSEIDPSLHLLACDRIHNELQATRQMATQTWSTSGPDQGTEEGPEIQEACEYPQGRDILREFG